MFSRNVFLRRPKKFTVSILSFFFLFSANRILSHNDLVRQKALRGIRERNSMYLVAALCLLVHKSRLNFALLGGNGNTLNEGRHQQ
jgi:hypothetical protein